MCIISVKPNGVELQKRETFKTMWDSNRHGAGFMYFDEKKQQILIDKGYMDFDSYWEAIQGIPNIKEKTVVFHLRITTHGLTCPQNCHPFPMSNRVRDLQSTLIHTKVGIVHNGIIPIEVKTKSKIAISDTMEYIKTSLYKKYLQDEKFYLNEETREEIKEEISSKMCILVNEKDFFLIGSFVQEEKDGCYYSNTSYISYDWSSFYTKPKMKKKAKSKSLVFDFDCPMYGRLLDWDEYVLIDKNKVYGDEMELVLGSDGSVYAYDDDTCEPYKICDEGYDELTNKILTYEESDYSFVI